MGVFTDRYGDLRLGSVLGAVGLTLALTVGGCQIANNIEYSNGVRVGVINKFSKKGFIWKTYEGQLALEGLVSSGTTSGANVWDFSLDANRAHGEDTGKLAIDIINNAESSQKVKIRYSQPWAIWPWRADTSYLVQSLEPVGK